MSQDLRGKDRRSKEHRSKDRAAPSFADETEAYLAWVETYCPLRRKDLKRKHAAMRASPFAFLRGSFYRWHRHFAAVPEPVRVAPAWLVIGDTHLENFGTWRDADGRLVWGVNDFDEAATLPFTSDLVRLATSAALETDSPGFRLSATESADAILEGYTAHLRFGPEPFVLEERHAWLRDLAAANGDAAQAVWRKLRTRKRLDPAEVPAPVRRRLEAALPPGAGPVQFHRRRAGIGSLGRPRYLALAEWKGGLTAREAKAAVPSAVHLGEPPRPDPAADSARLLAAACRAPDPMLRYDGDWVLRRLSPEARKVEIGEIKGVPDQRHLVHAMGREIANVHLGVVGGPGPLRAYLEILPDTWLRHSATLAAEQVQADFAAFRDTEEE
ncbi:DUF2252 family protein [Methylobacterium sp. ID0610]|uniref:DUF2252 family protein n=1 Tax=Methylobacterium carpenticola TaxID=3344827 RepID=UPI0036ACCC41